MALDRVHLRKVLKLFMLKDSMRSTAIRKDAGETMKKLEEGPTPGGDFPIPFWKAAKDHAAGRGDLKSTVAEQIQLNWRRKNLYTRFRDGFLEWWTETRRWINEEIVELPKTIKAAFGSRISTGPSRLRTYSALRLAMISGGTCIRTFQTSPL